MKKLLLSTLILLSFSLSVIIFQISCKKAANATTETKSDSKKYGLMLLTKVTGGVESLYTANLDGTNMKKVTSIPEAEEINEAYLSPDGKTIILKTYYYDGSSSGYYNYSCSIDGRNFKKLENLNGYELVGVGVY